MIRDYAGDEHPEFHRVVQFLQMAEFVYDDVVRKMQRQQRDAIIKIQILLLGAAPPPGFLIADGDAVECKMIRRIQFLDAAAYQRVRMRAIMPVCGAVPMARKMWTSHMSVDNCSFVFYFFSSILELYG